MNKLTEVEGNRILSVLDEALQGLHILSMAVQCSKDLGANAHTVLGESMAQQVREHLDLEVEYQQESEARDGGDRMRGESGSDRTGEIKGRMKETARAIYRSISVDPQLLDDLKRRYPVHDDAPRGSPAYRKFIDTLTDLKLVSQKRLSTSVEEDKTREDSLQEVIARERKASQEKKALEQELTSEKREREQSETQRNEAILKLIEEISNISTTSGENETALELKAQADLKSLKEQYEADKTRCEALIKKKTDELKSMRDKNEQQSLVLQKKKVALQGTVQDFVVKYDTRMTALDEEYTKIRALYDEELKELKVLEAHFAVVDEELRRQREKERRIAREKEIQKRKEEKNAMMALMLQKLIRGSLTRTKVMESRNKGGKKKKKK